LPADEACGAAGEVRALAVGDGDVTPSPESPPANSIATLEALYDAYHRQALGLAYHLLGNRAEAEETVQDAFLAAWRASASYDPDRGSTRTWFLTLVRHRAIDQLRARERRPVRSLEEAAIDPADEADVSQQVSVSVDGQVAYHALSGLPAEQRQAIELAYFGGLSHSQIAAQVNVPVGTIKGRIRLGLDRLRLLLGEPERSPSASQ
jgi:RNA polymerase sigma-70 factor, ECF subfamily